MKEEVISIELAKILKKKSFIIHSYYYDSEENLVKDVSMLHRKMKTFYPAPTRHQLQMWLIEEYEVYVNVTPKITFKKEEGGWTYKLYKLNPKSMWEDMINHTVFIIKGETYLEAFDKGLKEALSRI